MINQGMFDLKKPKALKAVEKTKSSGREKKQIERLMIWFINCLGLRRRRGR